MTVQLAPTPVFKAFDNNGQPLFNGTLTTLIAGSSTPQATYVDSTQTTPNANPIVLNQRGEANVWLVQGQTYKLVLQDNQGNLIWSVDNVAGGGIASATILNQPGTGFFYAQNGANVNRIEDRLFVGDATLNDGRGPTNPISADWLTQWQLSIGIPFGSVTSAQGAALTTNAALAVTSPTAWVTACRTFGAPAANAAEGGADYAVNNNTAFATSVWARYGEAHRVNNIVNSAIGWEYDVTQRGSLVGINPYQQNFGQTVVGQIASGAGQGILATASFATNVMTVTLINILGDNGNILVGWRVKCVGVDTTIASFGSGAGLTGTYNLAGTPGTLSSRIVSISPMFDNTAGLNFQANPNSFSAGINFGANSITGTDGINGVPSPAIQFGRFHGMFWFSSASAGTASIYSDASATVGSPSLQLGQSAFTVREVSSSGTNFEVALTTGAINFPFVQGATAGNSATIGALGGDTNVDLGVFCQGTGVLKMISSGLITGNGAVATTMTSLGPAGSHTTIQEWLTIKNAAGTLRYIPCY